MGDLYLAERGAAAAVLNGADGIVDGLIAGGVSSLFGVPGIQLDYFMDAVARRPGAPRYISCRHEQGAAHMADGFARASGRPGVFAVVPGPGLLNGMTGLATAYACSSPVVCLAANLPGWAIDRGLGLLHEIRSQEKVLGAVTKCVIATREVGQLHDAVISALGDAASDRPRPVAVSVPEDLLKSPGGPGRHRDVEIHKTRPDPAEVASAAELLSSARHPVVIVGGGIVAADASDALAALAAALRAPVVTTANGRGALSDRNPWTLTSLGGREALEAADVVLIVGSRGVRMNGTPLIQDKATVVLNADPADVALASSYAQLTLQADARLGLQALAAELTSVRSEWEPGELHAIRERCEEQIAGLGELTDWVRALRGGMADDDVLVGELTQVAYLSRVAFPVYEPRTYLSAGYQGTLGFGLPTAVGAQVARPDRRVVSISGDGGFAYGMAELLTAVANNIPATFVVFNDGAYGNVLRTQIEDFDGRTIGTRLHNPNFTEMGRVFGLDSFTAPTPHALTGLLRETAGADRPTLIEAPVGAFSDPGGLVREANNAEQN